MATHANGAHIVEKDDTCGAIGSVWLAEKCTDQDIRTARLVHNARTESIESFAKKPHAFGKWTQGEGGHAGNDYPRGFTTRMRIDYMNPMHDESQSTNTNSFALKSARQSAFNPCSLAS